MNAINTIERLLFLFIDKKVFDSTCISVAFRVFIIVDFNGSAFKNLDLYTHWSGQLHLPWYYVLDAELENGKHSLTIKINDDKNPKSNGNACRIKHFFVNE